jgi:lipoprotein-releasing system permease protein
VYKLFLCMRYLRKRRIAFFAVAAVCLCVAMVLIVVSVMGGFLQMVKDRSRGMLGDLIAENGALQGFPFYQEFIDGVKKSVPDVIEATPVIITYGVLRFPEDQITKPVQVVGIRLEETYRVNDFRKGLFYETYYPETTTLGDQKIPCFGLDEANHDILPAEMERAYQQWLKTATPEERAKVPITKDAPYNRPGYFRSIPIPKDEPLQSFAPGWKDKAIPGAIIGADLCAKRTESGDYIRYYYRGATIQLGLLPFTEGGKWTDATGLRSKPFRYVDDSRTGVYDIDSTSVYVDFDLLQKLVDMDEHKLEDGGLSPRRTTQVQMKLRPGADPIAARDAATAVWTGIRERHKNDIRTPELLTQLEVKTWTEKQAKFIAAVEKEKYLVTILFGVISVVAVFLVGVIFYMIVQQKTRDIGIVKSVGATRFGVAQIFLAYGAAVGVVGGLFGTVIGTVFVWYINDIQDLLAKISPGLRVWNAEVYAFDRIPEHVKTLDVVVIYAIAIFASMVGSLMAAQKAARVWPVEALRYE